jgi:CheY-like chemotaxis protein
MFFTDDDHDDLQLMTMVSDSLGHTSQLFHDGDQLLANLERTDVQPDIIFLDITMPRKSGIEILTKLRSMDKTKSIPIVIHSGNCDEKCISECYELGANYYVTKAYSYTDLKAALEYSINTDWSTYKAARENFLHEY